MHLPLHIQTLQTQSVRAIPMLRFCSRLKIQRRIHQGSGHCNNRHNETRDIVGTIPKGGTGLQVDQYAELSRTFTADEVLQYGMLIGDMNPIHIAGHSGADATNMDNRFLRLRTDGQHEAVVHGMFVGSLFSSIFGTLIPGSVYRHQSLAFCRPVFASEPIQARVEVTKVKQLREKGLLINCATSVTSFPNDELKSKLCVKGEAEVWLPSRVLAEDGDLKAGN